MQAAMNAPAPFGNLDGHHCIRLTTYRKNGTPVPTPVWFVRQAGRVIIWTAVDSGKARRLRRNPCVELAPSTHGGKPLGSSSVGRARFVPAGEAQALKPAFKAKYGWLYGLFALMWKIQKQEHTYIEIAPGEA
jgi:PPOX class probable F420-dependent enzyme